MSSAFTFRDTAFVAAIAEPVEPGESVAVGMELGAIAMAAAVEVVPPVTIELGAALGGLGMGASVNVVGPIDVAVSMELGGIGVAAAVNPVVDAAVGMELGGIGMSATASPPPWTPADIGVTGWIDFSDGSTLFTDEMNLANNGDGIRTVLDKSGNGHDFIADSSITPPTKIDVFLNGLSGANSANTDQYFRIIDGSRSITQNIPAFLIYCVFRHEDGSTTARALFDSANPSAPTTARIRLDLIDSAGTIRVGGRRLDGDEFLFQNQSVVSPLAPAIGGCLLDYQGNNLFNSFNGVEVARGTFQGSGNTQDTLSPAISIFNKSTGDTHLKGQIGEIVFTNFFVSKANRERIEGYLAHKWGLTGNLPPAHPFKTDPPLS